MTETFQFFGCTLITEDDQHPDHFSVITHASYGGHSILGTPTPATDERFLSFLLGDSETCGEPSCPCNPSDEGCGTDALPTPLTQRVATRFNTNEDGGQDR